MVRLLHYPQKEDLMKIDMKHMGTDALKKSHYLAFSTGNDKLLQEIEQIFKERGVDIPVYTRRLTFGSGR